jgi:hypothetical protein
MFGMNQFGIAGRRAGRQLAYYATVANLRANCSIMYLTVYLDLTIIHHQNIAKALGGEATPPGTFTCQHNHHSFLTSL